MKAHQLNRLQDLLDYIDGHLAQSLNLERLAEISCWSRWQLQRVFQLAYDLSVMSYVREQRLSRAANLLISSDTSINQIAIDCGFESQAVFSRAFKEHFQCPAKVYRQRGELLRVVPKYLPPVMQTNSALTVEIKTKPSFYLHGMSSVYNSALSSRANNQEILYQLWDGVRKYFRHRDIRPSAFYAFNDITTALNDELDGLTYWAGIEDNHKQSMDGLQRRLIPANNYAVFTHRGKLALLKNTLLQFLLVWLPQSNYRCVDDYELERHLYHQASIDSDDFALEFWFPVALKTS